MPGRASRPPPSTTSAAAAPVPGATSVPFVTRSVAADGAVGTDPDDVPRWGPAEGVAGPVPEDAEAAAGRSGAVEPASVKSVNRPPAIVMSWAGPPHGRTFVMMRLMVPASHPARLGPWCRTVGQLVLPMPAVFARAGEARGYCSCTSSLKATRGTLILQSHADPVQFSCGGAGIACISRIRAGCSNRRAPCARPPWRTRRCSGRSG